MKASDRYKRLKELGWTDKKIEQNFNEITTLVVFDWNAKNHTKKVEMTPMDMGNEVTVTDPSGRRVDDGTLTVAGNDLIVGMKPITQSGVYKVSYNIISEMDLPLEGSFVFNFSTPAISVPEEVVPTTPAKIEGSDFGTNLFVIGLLVASLAIESEAGNI